MVRNSLLIKTLYARPRLALSVSLGILVFLLLPGSVVHSQVTKAVGSWNVGALFYLLLAGRMMFRSSHEEIKTRALDEDEGQILVLVFVVLTAACTLTAIIAELAIVRNLSGVARYGHIALAAVTIATSWLFTHVMFAIHYAHEYFLSLAENKPGGIEFPGEDRLVYADFIYLAFIIGTSGQTADVCFSSSAMRKTATVHSVLAFIFNTTLVGLTINIASSLF